MEHALTQRKITGCFILKQPVFITDSIFKNSYQGSKKREPRTALFYDTTEN